MVLGFVEHNTGTNLVVFTKLTVLGVPRKSCVCDSSLALGAAAALHGRARAPRLRSPVTKIMYVCICVYIYIHVYMYICISLSLYIYIYMYMYTCTSLSLYIYIYMYIHVHTHIYIYIYKVNYFVLYFAVRDPPPSLKWSRRALRKPKNCILIS